MGMRMPKPDEASKDWFRSLVPEAANVQVRPMFGNLAAFVQGNMFLALFGAQVAVRLDEAGREELLAVKGTGPFEPMAGRPMKEYVTLPDAWRQSPKEAHRWAQRSYDWAASLPPKKK
jgi:TfoX/Sxy family transcriptional regulator of competence genes